MLLVDSHRRTDRRELVDAGVARSIGEVHGRQLGVVVRLLLRCRVAVGEEALRHVVDRRVEGQCDPRALANLVPDLGDTGDDRGGRVQDHRVGGLVTQTVGEDKGVQTLDCAENAGTETVEVRPDVVRDLLLDAVHPEARDVGLVVELVAREPVGATTTDSSVNRRRAGLESGCRASGVEVQQVRRAGVAGSVVRDDGVQPLDRTELSRLDGVEVGPTVVAEVLLHAVDGDIVDKTTGVVGQAEARDGGPSVNERRAGLQCDDRSVVVDGERQSLRLGDEVRGVERVVLHRVGARGKTSEVDRQAPARTARGNLAGVDEGGTGVDVRDDLLEADVVSCGDHEGCASAVEGTGRS